ncbi:MAG: hypothetical protein UT39_C0005G0045 [Candidatus Woesebacteria bacterium GW2011_GWA1_39_21]|uniref:Uncharacterized protein n=1 Tax=Candidatus Woesebacteria bacterium GW2011_GWA1_39_21 TaxID=1618550 RepID=A0A0G0QMM9_9BACT|nr:MAG: hypothetical protein UT39_C0005G0045 [Candidatus Woesebacteria bacterium GW2011_GWA1_39_21]
MLNLIVTRLINPQIVSPINTYIGGNYANRIVTIAIDVGLIICVIAFIILFLIGGAQWVMSGGNKQSLENARNKIVNAIIGLLILLLLWILLQVINQIFGVNIGGLGVPQLSAPAPTPMPVTTGICQTSGVSCSCSCLSGYVPASICNAACSGTCQCVSTGVNPGTCGCDLGVPLSNSCNSPYSPVCFGQLACQCLLPPYPNGARCQSGSECQSGACVTSSDTDGDGYFVAGAGVCAVAADCNDNNTLVNPGQTQYFQDPIAGTLNDFNYDCADGDNNGDPNDKPPQLNCLSQPPQNLSCNNSPLDMSVYGSQIGWANSVPVCGATFNNATDTFYVCLASESITANCSGGGTFEGIICNQQCVTGNNCGSGAQQCVRWALRSVLPFPSYFDAAGFSSLTRMPCK